MFDLDGTVYLGERLLPGARAVIEAVREANRSVLYLTNKPLDPSATYAAKLTRLGIPTAPDEVVSSLDAMVGYLCDRHPGASVLCVSEPLLADTLRRHGFMVLAAADAERADLVVVSFDRGFDYAKLHAAFRAVTAGAAIVATNPDRYCPTPEGGLPDCAAMLAAIEACTGVTAEAVVGKPSPQMAATILARFGLPAGEVLIVGDRLETDVAMAVGAGIDAALVLSGATDRAAARRADPPPTYVLDSIAHLMTGEVTRQPLKK
ncbi:HAD-IIA family hydrolase [Acrocarpospora macrocephala]|uniref:Acid sugar phosphatase n=1 Tax=Acrocarpospora macrocephala TaxID=150177 RepID=A0A5M3X5U5_9ACTN|nr:HAD-IIA family hydrolase [Acrocarpospora macrocephala]GES14263.1 acid sugar phosphatase [Acrocarpospora macrocephala]